jgi:hypothetical protein
VLIIFWRHVLAYERHFLDLALAETMLYRAQKVVPQVCVDNINVSHNIKSVHDLD